MHVCMVTPHMPPEQAANALLPSVLARELVQWGDRATFLTYPAAGSARADAGTADETASAVLEQVERAAGDGRKGERPLQQRVEHGAVATPALEVRRQGGKGAKPASKIVEDQEENPRAHGEREQDIEVVAPRRPRATRA